MNPLGRLLAVPVRIYRRVLSPLKPPTCRFSPTCSAYAIEAFERHGAVHGFVLASWRILRCQPFAREGFDPVPRVRPKWFWRAGPLKPGTEHGSMSTPDLEEEQAE